MSQTTGVKGTAVDRFSAPFLPLSENELAYFALKRFAHRSDPSQPGLVYLYGPSGSGKSHLLRQFAREARQQQPEIRSAETTAGELSDQWTTASDSGALHEFRQQHRDLQLLVCEDLQLLERHFSVQRALLVIIDEILHANGRLVLTSRRPPGQLSNALPRLVNRCHGGLCISVGLPGRASRQALLKHFSRLRQISLPEDVIHLLAVHLSVSPRELLAAVIRLEHNLRSGSSPAIDLDHARRFLDEEIQLRPPTTSEIARAVARSFHVRLADICSQTRLHQLVLARQCAMYLARELTNESLFAIGRYFGRPNHSTVAYAHSRIRRILPGEAGLRQQLLEIRESLRSLPSCGDIQPR